MNFLYLAPSSIIVDYLRLYTLFRVTHLHPLGYIFYTSLLFDHIQASYLMTWFTVTTTCLHTKLLETALCMFHLDLF